MPTIDELPPAVSVSDTDELVVSQSDTARKATRAQLLSGMQPAISLPSASLLGRASSGAGIPEAISIGANLTVNNGSISAPPPYAIAAQPQGGSPQIGDLVGVAQGGQNAAVSYGSFMGALPTVPGVNGSGLLVTANGTPSARRLDEICSDAIRIEAFGAVGDGVTDNTEAFNIALATGRPLRLDSRVYVVNGAIASEGPLNIIGIPASTIIRRLSVAAPGPWFDIAGSTFLVSGVIFDGNGLATGDFPLCHIADTCIAAIITDCGFIYAGGSTLGAGLVLDTTSGCSHSIRYNNFSHNNVSGLVVNGDGAAAVYSCSAVHNGANGIQIGADVRFCLSGNYCIENQVGISVGNWSGPQTASGPTGCRITGNVCQANTMVALAASGLTICLSGNIIDNGTTAQAATGLLVRFANGRITENTIIGFTNGIDARCCVGTVIQTNYVTSCATGLLLGGAQGCAVRGNYCVGNDWAVVVSAIEPAISTSPTGPVTLSGNWIGFSTVTGGGVQILDGAVGVAVVDNDFNGWGNATINQALHINTDAALTRSNRWNNTLECTIEASMVAGLATLVIPDLAEQVLVTTASPPINSILTAHQLETLGQITFVRVTDGGNGYSFASAEIVGAGTGAAAQLVISNGTVIAAIVTNPGSGYGSIGTTEVIISGDGDGASATAFIGLPVAEARRLRLSCNSTVRLVLAGSSPLISSWTGFDTTIPAGGAAEIEGAFGGWRIVGSPPVDYLAPGGDGSVKLTSVAGGDITLRPALGGSIHFASQTEANGCTTTIGRGSPVGAVAADPGSDYRNLDGGNGNTLFIKRSGTDTSGWVAIA